MNLIYYRGLNCYLASVINIATALGVNSPSAYATLWSETDFDYILHYEIFQSQRVLTNLKTQGFSIDFFSRVSPTEAFELLASLEKHEFFLIGIDTFYLPWSPVYLHFHSPHFIVSQKESDDTLFCYDPIYDVRKTPMAADKILAHAYDLGRIHYAATEPLLTDLRQEAQAVLQNHPNIYTEIDARIRGCMHQEQDYIVSFIKEIDAMLNNRYLFQQFLYHASSVPETMRELFDGDFLPRWEAVKNGLYKASIVKKNESVILQVSDLFQRLAHDEVSMARNIVS